MGELDPGAAGGIVVTNTADVTGTYPLVFQGPATYATDVSISASNATGSSLSVNFTDGAYATNDVVSTVTNNFGIECWVKPTESTNEQILAYNGHASFSGWGLMIHQTNYCGLFGGVIFIGAVPVVTQVWTHLALVCASGTTTLYANGAPAGTANMYPNPPATLFALGAAPQTMSAFFGGFLDEVRVFTFAAGQFSTNDLLWNHGRPTINSQGLASLTPTSAMLTATVTPHGEDTGVFFDYGTTTNYGNTVGPLFISGAASNAMTFNTLLTNLSPAGVYHFQVVATNDLGATLGGDHTFTTPSFIPVTNAVPGVYQGSIAWGDLDNDGFLDLVIMGPLPGTNGTGAEVTEVWHNNGDGTFSLITTSIPGVYEGSVALGDYDNDGLLDILITGSTGANAVPTTQLWRNTGNGFTNVNAGLTAVNVSRVAFGDYDNDGRLDILLAGINAQNQPVTQVWRNTGNGFSNINANLPGIYSGSVAWGDYDNDGRLDILLSGSTGSSFLTEVWRNTGNGFTNINAGLTGVYSGSAAWGDYDNDGRLDILLSGINTQDQPVTEVWRNTGNGFTNINAGMTQLYGPAAWGDYDNDGRLDILLSGINTQDQPVTEVWRNTGNGFSNINSSLTGLEESSLAWGDFNNDGRLDFILMGAASGSANPQTLLMQNALTTSNSPPTAPTGLSATMFGPTLNLSWQPASDLQTPPAGLSYNVRVGTSPGGSDIVRAAAGANGKLHLAQRGRVQGHQLTLQLSPAPEPGTMLYWSVQSVDTSFAGSPFAPEASLLVHPFFSSAGTRSDGTFEAQFDAQGGTNYAIQASTDLVHWVDLLDFSLDSSDHFTFTDPGATNYTRRFYRFGQH